MIILGIETSCDETALCLLETSVLSTSGAPTSFKILGNVIISQIDIHRQYGGVFPMVAKREHAHNLVPLLHKLFEDVEKNSSDSAKPLTFTPSTLTVEDRTAILERRLVPKEQDLMTALSQADFISKIPSIDMIAVTEGPGLEPALWVGINFAATLGELWKIPVHPVNHMEGHVVGSLLEHSQHSSNQTLRPLTYPALAVLISGGHTELVLMNNGNNSNTSSGTAPTYSLLGMTRDDAVGEAFDKVARMLGFPYPGGPEVSARAAEAREKSLPRNVTLPRPMIHSKDMDFSFSGLKTAVLYHIKEHPKLTTDANAIADICREFEDAVTEVLVAKTRTALDLHHPQTLIMGGGVIANTVIRQAFTTLAAEYNIPLYLPTRDVSGDNALMIALAGALFPRQASTELRAQGTKSLHSSK